MSAVAAQGLVERTGLDASRPVSEPADIRRLLHGLARRLPGGGRRDARHDPGSFLETDLAAALGAWRLP